VRDRDYKIEKSILDKSKSSRYLDNLSNNEKEYLDNIFFFVDSYKHKVKSLLSNTFSSTYCLTCGLKNEIPYDYMRKIPKKYCSNICNFKSDESRSKNSISQKNRVKTIMHSENAKKRYIASLNDNSSSFLERNEDIERSIILKKINTNQYHTILSNEEKSYINLFWGYAKTIRERVFLLENNVFIRQRCITCNQELSSPLLSNINGAKCLKKYCNLKCKSQSKIVREKISESVSNSYKNNLNLSDKKFKSGRSWKIFIMPSGKAVSVQGYEDSAIIEILKIYNEDDLLIHKDVPIIKYTYKNIDRNHFADFYIKSTNTLIDVKSQFTYDIEIDKNNAKKLAAEKQGFNYSFMIISGRKNENKKVKTD
jgi:hypothetical protein